MITTTWSQKLLCSCEGHRDAMWHHGVATIVNMTTCLFLGKYIIIIYFILIYLNDLKLGIQKYNFLL
jgi:hypothetical protein